MNWISEEPVGVDKIFVRVWMVALVSQTVCLSLCVLCGCIKVNEWFSVRSKREPTNMIRKNGLII